MDVGPVLAHGASESREQGIQEAEELEDGLVGLVLLQDELHPRPQRVGHVGAFGIVDRAQHADQRLRGDLAALGVLGRRRNDDGEHLVYKSQQCGVRQLPTEHWDALDGAALHHRIFVEQQLEHSICKFRLFAFKTHIWCPMNQIFKILSSHISMICIKMCKL